MNVFVVFMPLIINTVNCENLKSYLNDFEAKKLETWYKDFSTNLKDEFFFAKEDSKDIVFIHGYDNSDTYYHNLTLKNRFDDLETITVISHPLALIGVSELVPETEFNYLDRNRNELTVPILLNNVVMTGDFLINLGLFMQSIMINKEDMVRKVYLTLQKSTFEAFATLRMDEDLLPIEIKKLEVTGMQYAKQEFKAATIEELYDSFTKIIMKEFIIKRMTSWLRDLIHSAITETNNNIDDDDDDVDEGVGDNDPDYQQTYSFSRAI